MSAPLQTIHFKECFNWSVAHLLETRFQYNQAYPLVRIGDFLRRNKTQVIVQDDIEYKRVTIKLNNGGVYLRDKKLGKEIGTKKQYRIKEGQFLLSKIDARNGAFGLATQEVDGAIVTADFFAYDIDTSRINPLFLVLLTTTEQFKKFAQSASSGTTGRQRIDEKRFLDVKVPLPPLEKQREIVKIIERIEKKLSDAKSRQEKLIIDFNRKIFPYTKNEEEFFMVLSFEHLVNWSVAHLFETQFQYNQAYPLVRIGDFLRRNRTQVIVQHDIEYKRVTIKLNNGGVYLRDKKFGKEIGTKKQYRIKEGQFLLSKIDARNGAFGLATQEVDGAIVTADFFAYDIDTSRINPLFLVLLTTTEQFKKFAQSASSGTTGRQRIDEKRFLDVKVPLPPLNEQNLVISAIEENRKLITNLEGEKKIKLKEFEREIFDET